MKETTLKNEITGFADSMENIIDILSTGDHAPEDIQRKLHAMIDVNFAECYRCGVVDFEELIGFNGYCDTCDSDQNG